MWRADFNRASASRGALSALDIGAVGRRVGAAAHVQRGEAWAEVAALDLAKRFKRQTVENRKERERGAEDYVCD